MRQLKSILKRLARVAVAVILAGIPAYFGDNPIYMGFAPIISGIGKLLREQYNLKNVPF